MPGWSAVRKRLEQDLLCPVLRGRVQYFVTRYRHAHDGVGRCCIRVDGKDRLNMPFFTEPAIYSEANRRMAESEGDLDVLIEEVQSDFAHEGRFDPSIFATALNTYLNAPIKQSICSEEPLVRLFAILDRRVGRRTLLTIAPDVPGQPEWLRYFYELRLGSEGIPFERGETL